MVVDSGNVFDFETNILHLLESKVFNDKKNSTYQDGGMFHMPAVERAQLTDAL